MHAKHHRAFGAAAAAGAVLLLGGCTSDDMAMFADAMAVAADEMSVTMTMVPAYSCDYNVNGYLVCDDTGDGYADRYGADYEAPVYVSVPLTRVNDYGEAYVYDTGCSCWAREPSLDQFPDWDD